MKARNLLIVCMLTMLCGYNYAGAQSAPNCPQPTECSLKKHKMTPEQRMEKMVQRMEKRLLLDEATAAKFTPLYKEYLQALKKCHTAMRPQKGENKKNLTDAELDKQMQAKFAARKQMIETQENYYKQFKKILNIRQVEQLFRCTHPHKSHKMHKGHKSPHQCDKKKGAMKCHKHPGQCATHQCLKKTSKAA